MASGNRDLTPAPERDTAGLEADDTAATQEARPVPYVAGTVTLGVIWLCRTYRQRTEPAPDSRPAKK